MVPESVRESSSPPVIDGGGAGVRISVARGQIERSYRDGDDLVVIIAGGATLRVKEYFTEDDHVQSVLILETANPAGGYEVAEVSSENRIVSAFEVAWGQLEEMFGGRVSVSAAETPDGGGPHSPERSMGLSPMALGVPLGLLAAGAAFDGTGGGGGKGSSAPASVAQLEIPSPQQPQRQVQSQVEQSTPQPAVQQFQPVAPPSHLELSANEGSPVENDPLAALLADLATATVEMFEQAGVSGVDAGNLDDVKLVVGAYGTRAASLTLEQMQSLADIASAGIAVREKESLLSAMVDGDTMTLVLSVDADAVIEQREKSVALNLNSSTLTPTSLTRTFVLDSQYWNQRIDKDSDYNGTLDSVAWMDVDHSNGELRKTVTYEIVNGMQASQISEEMFTSHTELRSRMATHHYDHDSEAARWLMTLSEVTGWALRYTYHGNGTMETLEYVSDSMSARDTWDTSGRIVSRETYPKGFGEPGMIETFTYHDSGYTYEADEYNGDTHGQSDGIPEIRRGFDSSGKMVWEKLDSDFDGSIDMKSILSYDETGEVERISSDIDLDGAVDEIGYYGRNESGEKIYTLLDENADGTWDVLEYGYVQRQTLDADLAEQASGIASISMWSKERDLTLTITDEALSALAGSAEDYAVAVVEFGSEYGRRHTVDLRSGNIVQITGDGATDVDGRLGYQGTDAILYIDPDITVLV